MMQMPMGQYRPGNTFFHRADAKGKLLGLCLVIAAVIVSKGLIGCIAAAAAALTVSYLAGISLREQIKQQNKDQSPLSLSGGEKRRVAIAGVLATKPELLMLDEPLAGLDPMAREMFLEFLEGLTGQGVSVVMVSHNVDALAQHAARIIGMKQGKIVMDGSCQEVLGDSRALRMIGLLGSEAAQTAELLRANGVLPEGSAERSGLTPALQEEDENVWAEEKRILPDSGLPVTYEALRNEIIGALTGEKGENR